uniref:Reverse transcriptase domain-containing protein n=1 Tax=Xenopus tropicalis TaxID=8364 RepID=A0A803JJL3_XENTR
MKSYTHITLITTARYPKLKDLNGPILIEEVTYAIDNLKSRKVGGPDGLPPPPPFTFYKLLKDKMSPFLTNLFNDILLSGKKLPSGELSSLKVIPKKDKDLSLPSSYWPISLLTQDIKLLSKILADRLSLILPSVISGAQNGFIKNRSLVKNIRALLNIIFYTKKHKIPCSIINIDAEKAFDNLNWDRLFSCLDLFGINGPFYHYIQYLYSNPKTQVILGGAQSKPLKNFKGTRQGCPLSPLLFNIALEPLIRAFNSSKAFQGIIINKQQLKVLAFADDLLLIIKNPNNSLKAVFDMLVNFQSFSGYKVNVDKTEIMNPFGSISNSLLKKLQLRPPKTQLKYLGLTIPIDLNKLIP